MNPAAKPVLTRRPIKPPESPRGKARTTLCLPENMLAAIHRAMDSEGVSRKRRSQWITVAVERLFGLAGYEELILEEFIDPGGNKTIPVSLPKPLKEQIDLLVLRLARDTGKPVESSALLRTAISQYLLRMRKR